MKRLTSLAPLAVILLGAALPVLADSEFRIRRMNRDDVPLGRGQCDIRLQVDGEVEVAVRGDSVRVRTLSGQEARDDGSECNAPLPDRDLRGFNYEVKDSRNEIRLLSEPDRRNNFQAIVRIRDSSGGFGRYHFRLSWDMTGFDSRSGNDRPPMGRPLDPPFNRPGGGGFSWNNEFHFRSPGRGESQMVGFGNQRLFDVTVDIDRGGRVLISFRTEGGRTMNFSGTVIGREGEVLKTDVAADDRFQRVRGPMYISIDRRNDVYRINLEATNGRERLRVNWDRR